MAACVYDEATSVLYFWVTAQVSVAHTPPRRLTIFYSLCLQLSLRLPHFSLVESTVSEGIEWLFVNSQGRFGAEVSHSDLRINITIWLTQNLCD